MIERYEWHLMSKLLKVVLWVLCVTSYKTIPFGYFCRFYNQVIRILLLPSRSYRKKRLNTLGITATSNKRDVFKWIPYHTYVSPLEIDMYFHKSNSTYFADLDIARTKLVLTIFQKLFMDYFANTKGEFSKKYSFSNFPYIPVALVQLSFQREMTLFQRFTIESRVACWDQKWLFVVSKFTSNNTKKLHGIAVTKYVFKKNQRITIKPEEFIKDCGLWNSEVAEENTRNYPIFSGLSNQEDLDRLCKDYE